MGWFRRKDKPGMLGVSFHADGLSLVWLKPSETAGSAHLGVCDTVAGRDLDTLADALRRWVENHDAAGARCVAVLEPGSYQTMQLEPPEVGDDELRAALRWRVRDLISYPAEQAVIDVFPPPVPVRERVRNVNVVVARESLVRERISLLEDAGLRLDAIDIGQLAQRNVAARLVHDQSGIALLALDEDSGLITLVKEGEIYLARDLDFGLDALPPETEAEGDDPAYERITLELQRSLDYYESALGQQPMTRIVIFPGGPRTAGLMKYLSQNFFQFQIHELAFNDLIDLDDDASERLGTLPAGLHAVGAALRQDAAA